MNKQEIIEKIKIILTGIDETESDSEYGWWETSEGAKFGAKQLKALVDFIQSLTTPKSEVSAEEVADKLYPINKGGKMLMPTRDSLNNGLKQQAFVDGAKWMHDYSAQSNANEPQVDVKPLTSEEMEQLIKEEFEQAQKRGGDNYAKGYIDAMQTYATQSNAEAMREHAIDEAFIKWLNRNNWSCYECSQDDEMIETELWYNTYRFSVCENPKTINDLYNEYLKNK